MREFTIEDFSGAGQYLVRNDKEPNKYTDSGFLSTIMYKVGYLIGNPKAGRQNNRYCLTAMSDGWTIDGCFTNTVDDAGNKTDTSLWKFETFEGSTGDEAKQKLVDYLNNPKLCIQEMRFATQEEVVRVVMYQKSRWK